MNVIIVCHTEFGFVNNKEVIYDKNHKDGVIIGVPNLIKLADEYGIKITFAVMPEVADYFPKNIKHEIGLHIHPGWEKYKNKNGFEWNVGDEYLKNSCKQSSSSSVLWDYPYEEQFEMIKVGKARLKEKLGVNPRVFVSGRWCVNNDTIKALVENGFTHDCSAPAHSVAGHYDWSKLPRICMPYYPSKDDYQKIGEVPILIVPISRALFGVTANPEESPNVGYKWIKACFKEYYNKNVPLFHLCLHSPSVTDPYFLSRLENLFSIMSRNKDVKFLFASQVKQYESKTYEPNFLPYFFAVNKNTIKAAIRKVARL
jgi:peptidoglycan/xylan/chitin deacetylase (PgdA/CDA1 family)